MKRAIRAMLVLALMTGMVQTVAWAAEGTSAEEAAVTCPTCKTVTVTRHITDKVARKETKHLCPTCGTEWKPSDAQVGEQEAVHVCDTCGAAVEQCGACKAQMEKS